MSNENTITVLGIHEEEIPAISAEIAVTVRGSSLVTGSAALNKAREVAQLVADLKNAGLTDKDIKLQSVQAEVSSGMMGKSSSATYALSIHCENLDKLADLLGIITAQKNTTIRQLLWNYDDDENAYLRWLAKAIECANTRAGVVAKSLGVRLLGIKDFHEGGADRSYPGAVPAPMYESRMMQSAVRSKDLSLDLGMEVSHAKEISVKVQVQYHISGFESSPSTPDAPQ